MTTYEQQLNAQIRRQCPCHINEAKRVRALYGRGRISWDMATKLLLRRSYLPLVAQAILLGTHHLPGD